MDFDVFTEIVFGAKLETLACFSNERICRALSLKEILLIVPLIKTMLSSSVSQVEDIDTLIALFEKDDETQNDFLEKFTMAFICANNVLNYMRLGKI